MAVPGPPGGFLMHQFGSWRTIYIYTHIYLCIYIYIYMCIYIYICVYTYIFYWVFDNDSNTIFCWWENCGSLTHQPRSSLTQSYMCPHALFFFWWAAVNGDSILVGCSLIHRPESSPIHLYTCPYVFFLLLATVTPYFCSGGIMVGPCFTSPTSQWLKSCMWHDALIHWTVRHSPPTLRCNINESPFPPPTHISNLCVGGYMCTCVCAVRESVHTLTHPPSHIYTLIRYVTRIILYTSRFFFIIWCPSPWHVQKIDPTLRVLDYF